MTPAREGDNRWHLDKKVPLALIFAMLVQFAIAGTAPGRSHSGRQS